MSGTYHVRLQDLWEITRVRQMRLRLGNEYRAIGLRAIVIVCCAVLSLVNRSGGSTVRVAVLPILLLIIVAALGTVPLPGSVPTWLQPLVETFAAALVVGFLPENPDYFVPYLLIPLTTAGLTAGVAAALVTAGMAAMVFTITSVLAPHPVLDGGGPRSVKPLPLPVWALLLAAAGLVSAWSRRITRDEPAGMEPAYADAHRLLSELHVVARQLSLGLDPQTLAAALVEELAEIVGSARATVLVRSSGGRFVPVVGDAPGPMAESVVIDAWVAADLVRRGRSGQTVVALPVLMGQRVVAIVVLSDATDAQSLRDVVVEECRTAIAKAGPRLASALLFDDVRRLATVDERNRLAREIHDGIAQDMASVGYQLDDIASDAEPDMAKRIQGLREHLGGVVAELRLSIFDLRTGVDESMGLTRTLTDYVTHVGGQSGLIVHVSTDESPNRLPIATEVELLRIVQEAVTNVRRHADANNLWLTVVVDPPRAHVVVADDGRGLGTPRPDSMGITGMKERATRIGANLSVRNRPDGRGALVEVLLEPTNTNTRRNGTITHTGVPQPVEDSPSSAAALGRQSGGGPL
jgi:signal transduction histidine kinase